MKRIAGVLCALVVILSGIGGAEAGRIGTVALDSGDRPCDHGVRTFTWTSPFSGPVYLHRGFTSLLLGGTLTAQAELSLTVWGPAGMGFIAFEGVQQFAPPNRPNQIEWDYRADAIPIEPGAAIILQYVCHPFSAGGLIGRALFYGWVYDTP